MKKYYEEAKYNAAFDRCVDVMSQMLQKYGHQVLGDNIRIFVPMDWNDKAILRRNHCKTGTDT